MLTLLIGLVVIGIATTIWIRYIEEQNRLDIMRLMGAEIAERVVDTDGTIRVKPFLTRIVDSRQESLRLNYKPYMLILDEHDRPLFGTATPALPPGFEQKAAELAHSEDEITRLRIAHGERMLVVRRPIEVEGEEKGTVLIFSRDNEFGRNATQMQLLLIMLGSLGLLGWLVIYLLTKRLAQPIKNVADAAKQIVQGDYDVHLDKNRPEQELYELNHSFIEMADRLRQLEIMRTELLAGVTHELKTPVTSISGLVQAVKDEVVTGDESKEFLEICAKETVRLQKMVEDLLDFNSFAVGDIRIRWEQQNLNELVREIIHQWRIAHEDESITVEMEQPDVPVLMQTDPLRVQQILYNLLNNAAQAIVEDGRIEVRLRDAGEQIAIDVIDNGRGIPEAEQPLIFERFYRGEEKKQTRRGLGLGLSFSRMIAQALGGSLILSQSSPEGSVFTLFLQKQND